jgi:hypothetical protein
MKEKMLLGVRDFLNQFENYAKHIKIVKFQRTNIISKLVFSLFLSNKMIIDIKGFLINLLRHNFGANLLSEACGIDKNR